MPIAVYVSTHSDYKPYDYSKHFVLPIRIMQAHTNDHIICRHFTIMDSDKITPLYDVKRHPHTEYFDIFRCTPPTEASTDLTAGILVYAPGPVGTIDFNKDARKINLLVNHNSLEMVPVDSTGHDFEFKTSRWGVLTWKWLNDGDWLTRGGRKYKCVLEGADKWIAMMTEENDLWLSNYKMESGFLDELVVSWRAIERQCWEHVIR